jgi:protein CMS1
MHETIRLLKLCRIDFAVGTPDRLAALLEEKALSTANLKQVVIDVSYIDQKKRGILDMKELHESLIKFLLRKNFLGEGKERGDGLFLFF